MRELKSQIVESPKRVTQVPQKKSFQPWVDDQSLKDIEAQIDGMDKALSHAAERVPAIRLQRDILQRLLGRLEHAASQLAKFEDVSQESRNAGVAVAKAREEAKSVEADVLRLRQEESRLRSTLSQHADELEVARVRTMEAHAMDCCLG